MKKTNKKGFSIVELVIVLAIIAILAAVLIPTFASLIKKANVSKDNQLIRNLNTALVTDSASKNNAKHMTMTDALEAAEAFGYDVGKINASAVGNEILWDSRNDLFCYLDEATIRYIPESVLIYTRDNEDVSKRIYDVDYWVIKADIHEKYSTYLYEYTGNGVIENLTTGLDVGNEAVSSVSYVGGTSAQTVTIRTTSGLLKINAPRETDTVNHYGKASSLIIEAIGTSSYHEFGQVEYAQIKTGHIVIETSEAYINKLLLIAKSESEGFDTIRIEAKNGAVLPELDRTKVTIDPTDGTKVCEVKIDGESSLIWLYLNGVFENIKITDKNATSANGGTNPPAKTTALGKAAFEIANAAKRGANGQLVDSDGNDITDPASDAVVVYEKDTPNAEQISAGTTSFAGGIGTDQNPFLIGNATQLSNVRNYLGANYKVINDIDMTGVADWTPIGTSTNPFSGKLDGDSYSIIDWNTTRSLFGYIRGTQNVKLTGQKSDLLNDDNTLKENNISEDNYTCVIKHLNFEQCRIVLQYGVCYGVISSDVDFAYICDCEIRTSNIDVLSGWWSGCFIGEIYRSHIKNLHLASNNILVCSDNPDYLGNFGLLIGDIKKNETLDYQTIVNGCVNDLSTTIKTNGGYTGGILGTLLSGHKNQVIYNCVNNGNLTFYKLDTGSSSGGICGADAGGAYASFINCVNNGMLTLSGPNDDTSSGAYGELSGICGYVNGPFINCINNGTLFGYCKYMGGLGGRCSSNVSLSEIVNCTNNGQFINSKSDAETGELYGYVSSSVRANISASNINNPGITAYRVNLQNADSVTGTMVVQSSIKQMFVNGNLGFTKIDLSNVNGTFELNVSNATLELIGSNANASFTLNGTGNIIVVSQDSVLGNIRINGNNNKFTNDGVINHLCLANTSEECTNNSIMGSVEFFGSDNLEMAFVNNGTIGEGGDNWHTVQTQSQVNLTFDNNGTIYGKGTKYALLFYGLSNVVFNAGEESKLIVEDANYTGIFYNSDNMRADTVTFNIASGANGAIGDSYYGISARYIGETQITVNVNQPSEIRVVWTRTMPFNRLTTDVGRPYNSFYPNSLDGGHITSSSVQCDIDHQYTITISDSYAEDDNFIIAVIFYNYESGLITEVFNNNHNSHPDGNPMSKGDDWVITPTNSSSNRFFVTGWCCKATTSNNINDHHDDINRYANNVIISSQLISAE